MAGILPFSYHPESDTFYYLLGRESSSHPKDAKKYSDFGGSKEGNESKFNTAVREGYEETNGMFGTEHMIRQALLKTKQHHNTFMALTTKYNTYKTYLFEIPYNETLATYMTNLYRFMNKNLKNVVCQDNGYFEKDNFIYVTLDEIKKTYYSSLREFYKQIVNQIDEERMRDYIL